MKLPFIHERAVPWEVLHETKDRATAALRARAANSAIHISPPKVSKRLRGAASSAGDVSQQLERHVIV